MYSLYDLDGTIISFYPIKQTVIGDVPAWIVTYQDEKFISIIVNNSNIIRASVSFMLLIILMFINRVLQQQKELEREKIKAQKS